MNNQDQEYIDIMNTEIKHHLNKIKFHVTSKSKLLEKNGHTKKLYDTDPLLELMKINLENLATHEVLEEIIQFVKIVYGDCNSCKLKQAIE